MNPKQGPGPFDTRPLPTTSADHEPLGGHPLIPGSDHTGPEHGGLTEDGFVGGFRSEPDPADEPTPVGQSAEEVLSRPPNARDVTDELTAPPRRRLPALTLVLGAGVFATVGFLAGVEVQKDDAGKGAGGQSFGGAQAASQYGGRGAGAPAGTGQGAGAQPGTGTGASSAAGVTTGTVKVVDGSFIYVSDSSGTIIKVKTDAGTKIQVTQDGKALDLTPGDTVVVRGATGEDGSVTATTVTEGSGSARSASGGQG